MATGLQISHAKLFQEAIKNGLQSFVMPSYLEATSAVGTPPPGYFYSEIKNRAPITDISKNLKAAIGVERIIADVGYEVLSESGSQGERVWAISGEERIRFIGEWDLSERTYTITPYLTTNYPCFIEVIFYGTDLNLMISTGSIVSASIKCSIDQSGYGNELSLYSSSSDVSAVVDQLNYDQNQILNVAKNLPLGIHVAKIKFERKAAFTRNNYDVKIFGLEILNNFSNVIVNGGTAFINGLKTVSNGGSLPYLSGVTGTKGGRQLIYIKNDGQIGASFRPVDSQIKYLSQADHSGEEILKTYFIGEFGRNVLKTAFETNLNKDVNLRDFLVTLNLYDYACYTLCDGTTTLSMINGAYKDISAVGSTSEYERVVGDSLYLNGLGNLYFTFIGTGLDLLIFSSWSESGSMNQHSVTIDGELAGYLPETKEPAIVKIASGLPYGTHVVKITNNNNIGISGRKCYIKNFTVYQPKKPSLPPDCIELAEFNVVANYSINNSIENTKLSTGVIRKMALMGTSYYKNYWGSSPALNQATSVSGYTVDSVSNTNSANAYAEFYFWGTGVELKLYSNTTIQFSINDISNFSTMQNLNGTNGIQTSTSSGLILNNSTGVMTGVAPSRGSAARFLNLPLGLHKLKILKSGTGDLSLESFDVITPVHFPKFNSFNTKLKNKIEGGNSISDIRKNTLVKNQENKKSAVFSSGQSWVNSTTSTLYVPVHGASVLVNSSGGWYQFFLDAAGQSNNAEGNIDFSIAVGGKSFAGVSLLTPKINTPYYISKTGLMYLGPGSHLIEVRWRINRLINGATPSSSASASLNVIEIS